MFGDDVFFYYWLELVPAVADADCGGKVFIFYVDSSPGITFFRSSYYNDY